MIYSFIVASFLKNMNSIMDRYNISVVTDSEIKPIDHLNYEETLDGFGSQNFLYFYEAVNKRMGEFNLKLASSEFVFFSTSNGKKLYYFGLQKKNDEYVLYGETQSSMKYFLKNVVYSGNGLIWGFDRLNKESLDSLFVEGKVSFENNYNPLLYGLHELEERIDENEKREIQKMKIGIFEEFTDEQVAAIKSDFDMTLGRNKYEAYDIALYVMSVFSFIEHVAILVLPFWFSMRKEQSFWNDFCDGFHPAGFDTFRDFWTSNDRNWIDSFVETLCHFHRDYYRKPEGHFSFEATEEERGLKRLYERLRVDYRNPIHHGLATGENRTGLSMEVPSLKKRVLFNMPPLMRQIDSKTFLDTKRFLELFVSVLKNRNEQIVEYLETELNVPVDCSELGEYILDEKIGDFIDTYRRIEEHSDEIVRSQAGEWR